jgi:hypothetical protein
MPFKENVSRIADDTYTAAIRSSVYAHPVTLHGPAFSCDPVGPGFSSDIEVENALETAKKTGSWKVDDGGVAIPTEGVALALLSDADAGLRAPDSGLSWDPWEWQIDG